MVNLYKSVSRKEMTPSGKGDELLKSIFYNVNRLKLATCGEELAGSVSDDA